MLKRFSLILVMMVSLMTVFAQEDSSAKPGIFYNGEKVGSSRITGQRLGNLAGAYLTLGLSGAKRDLQIEGKTAELTIKEKRPVFTVIFAENAIPAVFQNADNADYLILVKLKQGKNDRKLQTGSYGLTGVESNVASKYVMPMKVERLSENVFTFTPKEDLKKGEYGFYFNLPKLSEEEEPNAPESAKPYNGVIDFNIK